MSLQVWLPLNGNLDNQGLADVTITNNNATININGKIGSCYSFGTNTSYINLSTNSFTNLTNDFSVSCWVKILSWNTSWSTIWAATSTSQSWNNIMAGLFRNSSSSRLLFCIGNNSASTQSLCLTTSDVVLNQWYHFTCVYTTGVIKLYQDGILVNSYTTNIVPAFSTTEIVNIGGMRPGVYQSNSLINDFRIYNHALSPKEVKELSKGLVLHYKLNDGYAESTTNLTNSLSSTCYNGATGKYSYGTTTDMYKISGNFQGKQCEKVYMGTANLSARPYIYLNNMFVALSSSTYPEYKTISFDYYPTIGTYINPYKLGTGSSTANYTVINKSGTTTGTFTNSGNIPVVANTWNHIELILHATTTDSAQWGYWINGDAHTSSLDNYWLFANIQIEEKDHATPYTESSRSIGICQDSSGYNRNGTFNTEQILSNESSRYDKSLIFNGTNTAILIPFNNALGLTAAGKTDYSISCWFYKTELSSKNYDTLFGGPSGFEIETRRSSGTTPEIVDWNWGQHSGGTYNLNEWHHFAMTQNSTVSYWYLNGNLIFSGSSVNIPYGNFYLGSWNTPTGQNYKGKISDFRVYATALSADDIKELYNTSASICNNGVLMAREVIE